jgi:hypothetical protein
MSSTSAISTEASASWPGPGLVLGGVRAGSDEEVDAGRAPRAKAARVRGEVRAVSDGEVGGRAGSCRRGRDGRSRREDSAAGGAPAAAGWQWTGALAAGRTWSVRSRIGAAGIAAAAAAAAAAVVGSGSSVGSRGHANAEFESGFVIGWSPPSVASLAGCGLLCRRELRASPSRSMPGPFLPLPAHAVPVCLPPEAFPVRGHALPIGLSGVVAPFWRDRSRCACPGGRCASGACTTRSSCPGAGVPFPFEAVVLFPCRRYRCACPGWCCPPVDTAVPGAVLPAHQGDASAGVMLCRAWREWVDRVPNRPAGITAHAGGRISVCLVLNTAAAEVIPTNDLPPSTPP